MTQCTGNLSFAVKSFQESCRASVQQTLSTDDDVEIVVNDGGIFSTSPSVQTHDQSVADLSCDYDRRPSLSSELQLLAGWQ